MRSVKHIYSAPPTHWVGDGFHVSPLFSHMDGIDKETSPFLMLDYGVPTKFAPNSGSPRGVGSHPHAGFETVTIALQGEIAHRDSSGGGGIIGTGDVQWMTAGRGIVHEEFHSQAFSKRGGVLEELQFWVNLPREFKNVPPAYQPIAAENIPTAQVQDANIRIIAGQLAETKGPARTFSEINMWTISLKNGGTTQLDIPETHNLMLIALRGKTRINGTHTVKPSELVKFETESGAISLNAQNGNTELVLISGVPIDEPVAAYGPFVMNTQDEIIEKIRAFKAGEFGKLD